VYAIQQHLIKEEAEEQLFATINDDQFEKVDLTANYQGIVWEEEGKEFFLNGQMYDVAKKEIKNGKTILYCLNDKKEQQLLQDFVKKIKSNTDNTSGNKNSNHTVKFQLSDFTELTQKSLIEVPLIASKKYHEFKVPLYAIIKKVNTPPPNNNLSIQNLIL
jgi:hypothetical protein